MQYANTVQRYSNVTPVDQLASNFIGEQQYSIVFAIKNIVNTNSYN